MKLLKITVIVVFLFNLFHVEFFCQSLNDNNTGQLLIKYFSPKDYKSSYQNWCVLQGKNNLMYFGNNSEILEYDGNTWRTIKTPNNSIVRSLDSDINGRIYVAASSDFGYLAPDSIGKLKFVSLLNYLEEKYKLFGDVWDVAATKDYVYFKTQNKIFRWNNKTIKVFENVTAYRLYKIVNDVYVRNSGVGLLKISGDNLIEIPDGSKFASIGIYDMLPFENKILVTTNRNGLFLYDGKNFSQFKTEADTFLFSKRIYNACKLNDSTFAFATQRGGAAVINKDGRLLRIINSSNGLPTDIVYDVYLDHQGGLWLATGEGIARIEIVSPFTIIPKSNTSHNYVSALLRFNNILFAANSFGLLYLDEVKSEFNIIEDISSSGGNFISIGNSLFGTTNNRVIKIEKKRAETIFNSTSPLMFVSNIDSTVVYLVYRIGLSILKYYKGTLLMLKEIPLFKNELGSILEDEDGSLWINTLYQGVIHLQNTTGKVYEFSNINQLTSERFNSKNGLPGENCNLFFLNKRILFATDYGLFHYDSNSKKFISDFTFGKSFTDSSHSILLASKNKKGDLWILANTTHGRQIGKAVKQLNGSYLWKPDLVFKRFDLNNIFTIYSDYEPATGKEFLWISSDEGLIRYNPQINKNYKTKFQTYIRRIVVNRDSEIYGGIPAGSNKANVLSSENNNIHFQFSATSYDKSEANLFQHLLEGEENDWSDWTFENTKQYTNLSSGEYKFRVRSKNIYGAISSEDIYSFSILSPWYFSWWTYIVYAFIFTGILFMIRKYELKRLNKKHELELEHIKYEKLKELDQLKSQFFANISHEFRTPLTLILGQVESVLSSNIGTKEKGKLHVANRNARRLLTLINQLLDLSKLEAGSMQLNAEQHNIVSFLKSLFYSFESLAESQKITLRFESELENIPVIYDPDKMEKVFYNLLSNAFKFTSAGGQIIISLKKPADSIVEIRIKDTGKGINKDHLPHVFNRFYQADSTDTREFEGTGIGLALAKELIELHKGSISVNSEEGKWTEFIIHLPSGDMSLQKKKPVEVLLTDTNRFNVIENSEFDDVSGSNNKVVDTGKKLSERDGSEIILIIEDNSDVRNYIREQTECDYRVIEASDGEEGISEAQKNIPDLIITDVMMPKIDGYKFSRKIRDDERTSHIPIIMITAKAGLDDKIEGFETGIDAYLTKPFSAKELKVRIKNLINQRKELRKRFSKATVIKPSEVSPVSVDQVFLEKTIKIIETHFEDDQFGVDKLADTIGMSVSQLNRKLNALIDQPAGQLIRSLRLQRAADLLKQNAGTVAEICYMVGFNDQAYFSRSFKKQFGCPPTDYKKII